MRTFSDGLSTRPIGIGPQRHTRGKTHDRSTENPL
jgi:hypothetical protein